ncbi:MAG TPA: DNA double-strand break repair nuclease NurA [Aggregatilineales bacterium]|nr:DNA double-strand break repair nuclease NurA [Anaerolineales bacterium]HRE47925.1 DNA double-strand break repair nuclease NurA [Aggregatilineales bacterium]
MALPFEKIEPQVAQMGLEVADQRSSILEQTETAFDLLMKATDLNEIWERILLARHNDAGFRGAAPMDEPLNRPIDLCPAPDLATIYAADGSQIYPDQHAPAPYWLTNIGVFIYHHGTDRLPEIVVEPQLYYREEDIRDSEGRLISSGAINARRTVYEMQTLAKVAIRKGDDATPRIALYDGPLIGMPMGKDIPNAGMLTMDYHEAMDFLFDEGVALTGYVDRPSSRFLVYTLYLMTLTEDEVTRLNVSVPLLENITDSDLYARLLPPGSRSGLMIQQSPLNKEYKERHGDHQEIVFFYLNAASTGQAPYIVRVELPMWVARNKPLVNAVQSILHRQCQITDRYPYALTRADEIAVVQPAEKRYLDDMIAVALLKNRQRLEMSQKLSSKHLARYGRRHHEGV